MVNIAIKNNSTHRNMEEETGRLKTTDQQQRTTDPNICWAVNLGTIDYSQAWKLQSDLVSAKINRSLDRDIILFLEHPAVFTLGRRGGREYLQVGESFLEQAGVPVVQAERGGYITFHGPGQLVVYPIIDLEARRLGVTEFVAALEEIMLQTVSTWGLTAQRNSKNAGIWTGNRKMGSIGIALRKGISFHGLALNVNVDLTPFSWVQPCGLEGVSMTSIQQELGEEIPMDAVFHTVKKSLKSVLELDLNDISPSDLRERLLNRINRKMPDPVKPVVAKRKSRFTGEPNKKNKSRTHEITKTRKKTV